MNKEQLIAKGVARKYENGEVVFSVESLHEHYDGINYHLVDINEDGFIRANDVFGDDIRGIEVNVDEVPTYTMEIEAKTEEIPLASGMTYEEAKKLMDVGELIALPEWGGFWFKSIKTGETIVLTKEGEITNTPWEECKERNDWITVEANLEQKEILDAYFAEEVEVIEPEVVAPETISQEEVISENVIESPLTPEV